jgi:hypothetical protein
MPVRKKPAIGMPAKLDRLEKVLRDQVSPSGGWPHWLHLQKASTSIVGTSHALAMLRMRGLEANDKLIREGLQYLAREVKEQTKPTGRGAYSRYPAYALWGFMRFPAGLDDPEVFDSAKFAASWLMSRTRPDGGWAVGAAADDGPALSLPATMPAVHGLDRMAPFARGAFGHRCAKVAGEARDEIVRLGEESSRGTFWRQRQSTRPCPGATSLAVLTLAGGSTVHRDAAARGIEYLRRTPKEWTTAVHVDEQLDQRTWRLMSFSLGLRALLHPCAARRAPKKVIREVILHFDDLWDDDAGAWAVQQGHDASTTGSYAVVAAVRALKNAWSFDPAVAYRVGAEPGGGKREVARATTSRPASPRTVRLLPGVSGIAIRDPELSDQEFEVVWDEKAKSQWGMLKALLDRRVGASENPNADQYDYTLSPTELAQFTPSKTIDDASVVRTIRRINEKIAEEAQSIRIAKFPALIEEIVPGDSREVRYGIEETEILSPRRVISN